MGESEVNESVGGEERDKGRVAHADQFPPLDFSGMSKYFVHDGGQ